MFSGHEGSGQKMPLLFLNKRKGQEKRFLIKKGQDIILQGAMISICRQINENYKNI